jgi:hypothetical protein
MGFVIAMVFHRILDYKQGWMSIRPSIFFATTHKTKEKAAVLSVAALRV